VIALHSRGLDKQAVAKLIASDPFLADGPLPGRVFVPPQRIITFEFANRPQAFSLGFVGVPALRNDPARLVRLIHDFNAQIDQRQGRGGKDGGYDRGTGVPRPSLLAQAQADQAPADDPALAIRRATPNWLSSGAPYVGGGGPGSNPIPAVVAAPAAEGVTGKQAWEFTLPEGLPPGGDGAGVQVAILDTAPDQAALDLAYELWGATNPLIADLLGPAGTLQISRSGYATMMQLADGSLAEHPYPMPDHGLFVAGIIRTLAPQASLQLIEVLNPYGVGTVETIALGMQQLANRPDTTQPLLINLSLVLNIPPADLLDELKKQDPMWEPFTQQTLEESSQILELVCAELSGQNAFLVAAAGNDGSSFANSHPLPHYPAAYHSVLGVGALNADDTPAPYSNACDDLLTEGLAVFGGSVDPLLNGDADPQHGMLGVYASQQFPSAQINENGWARWSGTSFATPTLTGTIAKMIDPNGLKQPADVITLLRAIDTSPPTVVGESVHITQG
jgi:hypothetical protein